MRSPEIDARLDVFISGADVSLQLANRIEVLLEDAFPDDDFMQETVEFLACYRPERGESVRGVVSWRPSSETVISFGPTLSKCWCNGPSTNSVVVLAIAGNDATLSSSDASKELQLLGLGFVRDDGLLQKCASEGAPVER